MTNIKQERNMPKCKTDGCQNQAEAGKAFCRECERKKTPPRNYKEEQAQRRRQAIGYAIVRTIGRILSQH